MGDGEDSTARGITGECACDRVCRGDNIDRLVAGVEVVGSECERVLLSEGTSVMTWTHNFSGLIQVVNFHRDFFPFRW